MAATLALSGIMTYPGRCPQPPDPPMPIIPTFTISKQSVRTWTIVRGYLYVEDCVQDISGAWRIVSKFKKIGILYQSLRKAIVESFR